MPHATAIEVDVTAAHSPQRREAQPDVGRETVVAGSLDVQGAQVGHAGEALVEGRTVDLEPARGRGGITRVVEEGLDRSRELPVPEQGMHPRIDRVGVSGDGQQRQRAEGAGAVPGTDRRRGGVGQGNAQGADGLAVRLRARCSPSTRRN